MPCRSPGTSRTGASLIELLVACALLAVVLTSVAPLVTVSARMAHDAELSADAARAALNQMEGLRALPWWVGETGTVTDIVSDVSLPEFTGGGPGLALSTPAVLDSPAASYEDQLDTSGARAPGTGRLVRRWAILPSPVDPGCVTLIVEVAPAVALQTGTTMSHAASARLQTTRCAAGPRP